MTSLASIRLHNTLLLRDHFTRRWRADSDPRADTPERSFAELIGVSPAHWSQLKSGHRHVGEKLARQVEAHCKVAAGSLDEAGAERLPVKVLPATIDCADDDERHAVQLFLAAYRADKQAARQAMLQILQARLQDAADAPARKSTRRGVDSKAKSI